MQLNVIEYLENGALRHHPDRVAVREGDKTITFAQLADQARRLSNLLHAREPAQNRPVAVYLPKGIATVVADLAIIYSGKYYTNLDTKSPANRLLAILGNVEPGIIITDTALAESLVRLGVPADRLLCIDRLPETGDTPDAATLLARRDEVLDTDPLCIINTSGSTGIPKSVILNHRGTVDFIDWVTAEFTFSGTDVMASLSPFYFDIYTLELYVSLAKGCTIAIIPEGLAAFPARIVEFLETQGATFLFWVPTIMVNIANQGLLAGARLEKLRTIFFAGEVFPTRHLNLWRKHLPHALFVNLYGPIEISVDCTYYVVDREFRDDEPLPIGRKCRNTGLLILNEQNQPAAVNEPGELCVRGSGLALGYWNNPEQTARVFVQNPLNTKYPEIIYRTGDLVHQNERGEIMFMGRKDFQIKHQGFRIELGEIENACLAVPGLRNACVLYQRERKEITLFYESDQPITPADLRASLAGSLPKYMWPTVLHHLAEMPRNPNGKIDRKALGDRLG